MKIIKIKKYNSNIKTIEEFADQFKLQKLIVEVKSPEQQVTAYFPDLFLRQFNSHRSFTYTKISGVGYTDDQAIANLCVKISSYVNNTDKDGTGHLVKVKQFLFGFIKKDILISAPVKIIL